MLAITSEVDRVKQRHLVYLGIAALVSMILYANWSAIALWNAKRLGETIAAREAAEGKFQFEVLGSTAMLAEHYPGVNDCLVPDQGARVTDLLLTHAEQEQAKREDAFSVAHNQYLMKHFPKEMAARCRRRAPGN